LAIEAGCNAYAAPLGFLEAGAREFAGDVPLILKLNSKDLTSDEKDPISARTGTIDDALRLGCAAVGFTIYPGSALRLEMYEQLAEFAHEAKQAGLVVVVWSYPRGTSLSKEGETAMDVDGYAAHIACQIGAHIVKIKLPSAHLEQQAAKKVYEAEKVPIATVAERVRHCVQCAFDGRRLLIFSGGPSESDEKLLDSIRAIRAGGGFGSIIGRNSFQRSKKDGLKLLRQIMEIYADQKK
jgi:class I fructose-bisphosphate aldolase